MTNTIEEIPSSSNPFEALSVEPKRYAEPTPILDGFLWVGSQDDAADLHGLRRLGITHVLNAAADDATVDEHLCALEGIDCDQPYDCDRVRTVQLSADYYRSHGFPVVYAGYPLDDTPDESVFPYFEKAIRFLVDAQKQNGRVLVNCVNGISRSVTLVTCFLMSKAGGNYSLENAARLIKTRRYIAGPNAGFIATLLAFAKRRRKTYKTLEKQHRSDGSRRGLSSRRARAGTTTAALPADSSVFSKSVDLGHPTASAAASSTSTTTTGRRSRRPSSTIIHAKLGAGGKTSSRIRRMSWAPGVASASSSLSSVLSPVPPSSSESGTTTTASSSSTSMTNLKPTPTNASPKTVGRGSRSRGTTAGLLSSSGGGDSKQQQKKYVVTRHRPLKPSITSTINPPPSV